jgi:hypothetical protein
MRTAQEVMEMRDWIHGLVNIVLIEEAKPPVVSDYLEGDRDKMEATIAGMLFILHRLLQLLEGDGLADEVRLNLLDAIEAVNDAGTIDIEFE